jgi:ATP-binding cassette subfamily F protein 3
MTDISVSGLVKSYEIGKNVLDGLSFEITAGEHVGILGPNGCGKTTLFRILVGALDYDEGTVAVASGKRIGLISQIPVYPEGWTTEDVLKDAHKRLYAMQERMDELTEQMESDPAAALINEYDRLSEAFRTGGGYDMDVERNRVANGLDIPEAMRNQPFESLSGGEKTRVNLARLILEDTDILLLDEPTNHLDLHATEWLEDYILHFRGTVLAISHDRYFLDVMCQRCIEISDGRAELYSGNYSFYVEERQRRFEEKLKKYEKDQAKVEQLTRAAEQMHLWAFMGADKLHKRAFSMEKRIEKLQTSEKPTVARKLTVKFKEREFSGDEVLVVDSVSKAFGEKKLFSDLSLTVTGGERIALIGDNGTGKSTLIKMIMHDEAPDAGILYTGPAVRTGYLPQIVEFSDMSRTCLDTMLYDCRCQPQEARDRLAAFGFRGEDVLIPVSALSGGERSRLKLCMVMGGDINFLILDEPTNHLDISSREWMEDAISDYTQALLFVSHDRYFIEKFATRVWALENGALTDFRGSFSQYREYVARQQVFAKNEKTSVREKAPRRRPPNTAKRLERLEKDIEKAEERISELDALAEVNGSDYQKLMEIGDEKTALEGELEELYRQWEELSD